MAKTERPRSVFEVEGEVDRGYSFQKWKELEGQGVPCYEEQMKLGNQDRSPKVIRAKYSVLKDLLPGDSIFLDGKYGLQHLRSAALGYAYRFNQTFVTRQSYEGGRYGLRVFRLY